MTMYYSHKYSLDFCVTKNVTKLDEKGAKGLEAR
jgi:hypothetical protein